VVEEPEEPPEQIPYLNERNLLTDGSYSDEASKFKSIDQIKQKEIPDTNKHLFYLEKSNVQLFRFEDVIFTVFPHLASFKRRAATTREIFLQNDPFNKTQPGQ